MVCKGSYMKRQNESVFSYTLVYQYVLYMPLFDTNFKTHLPWLELTEIDQNFLQKEMLKANEAKLYIF